MYKCKEGAINCWREQTEAKKHVHSCESNKISRQFNEKVRSPLCHSAKNWTEKFVLDSNCADEKCMRLMKAKIVWNSRWKRDKSEQTGSQKLNFIDIATYTVHLDLGRVNFIIFHIRLASHISLSMFIRSFISIFAICRRAFQLLRIWLPAVNTLTRKPLCSNFFASIACTCRLLLIFTHCYIFISGVDTLLINSTVCYCNRGNGILCFRSHSVWHTHTAQKSKSECVHCLYLYLFIYFTVVYLGHQNTSYFSHEIEQFRPLSNVNTLKQKNIKIKRSQRIYDENELNLMWYTSIFLLYFQYWIHIHWPIVYAI